MNLKNYIATSERGTAKRLAEALGVSKSMLSQLAAGTAPMSPERAIEIEKHTKGQVRCEVLCPEVDWAYVRGSKKKAA